MLHGRSILWNNKLTIVGRGQPLNDEDDTSPLPNFHMDNINIGRGTNLIWTYTAHKVPSPIVQHLDTNMDMDWPTRFCIHEDVYIYKICPLYWARIRLHVYRHNFSPTCHPRPIYLHTFTCMYAICVQFVYICIKGYFFHSLYIQFLCSFELYMVDKLLHLSLSDINTLVLTMFYRRDTV